MPEEKKETVEKESHSKSFSVDKSIAIMRKNPWIAASIVLALVVIIMAVVFLRNGSVTGDAAAENLLVFIEDQTGQSASLVSVNDSGSLYEVVVNFQGQEVPVYVTKDGKYLINSPIPITGNTIEDASSSASADSSASAKEVPKSDKPVVDLYVFSYCPYGTQMEKAMVPAYNLLKGKADINIVYIGAMHGDYERIESLRQICVEKNYGKDRLFAYLDKFNTNSAVGSCNGKDSCVNPLIEAIYSQIGIDKAKINSCMTSDADALYQADMKQASSLGIGGSPTITINGVTAQVGRSPELIKEAICDAFNTAPSECSTQLSTTSASAGFGSSSGSSSSGSC